MPGVWMRGLVFAVLVGCFFGGTLSIRPVLNRFSRTLPDNYRYIAEEAIRRGDVRTAEAVVRQRIAKSYYDFSAHYLLADVLAQQKRFAEAVGVIKDVLEKLPAVLAKKASATGYSEPLTLYLLTDYLWEAGKYFESGEMARAVVDSGSAHNVQQVLAKVFHPPPDPEARLASARLALKLRNREAFERALAGLDSETSSVRAAASILRADRLMLWDHETTRVEEALRAASAALPDELSPKLALATILDADGRSSEARDLLTQIQATTGTRSVRASQFKLPVGGTATTESILLRQSGTARIELNTGVFRVTSLLCSLRGSSALGLYPMVAVQSGEEELTRLYVDQRQWRLYDLALWPRGAPKVLDLRYQFTNDAYDPYSKDDRNVWISAVMLH